MEKKIKHLNMRFDTVDKTLLFALHKLKRLLPWGEHFFAYLEENC